MKTANVEDILKWKGELVQVRATSTGKVIYMRPLADTEPCGVCGHATEYAVVEASPLFQQNAKPIDTLKE